MMKICEKGNCNEKVVAKYLCRKHYDIVRNSNYRNSENGKKAKARGQIKYRANGKGKIAQKKYQAKYRLKFPEKIKARNIASKIKQTTCNINGCNEIGERHHEDYSKPLEVIFLCKKHHTMVGNSNKEIK